MKLANAASWPIDGKRNFNPGRPMVHKLGESAKRRAAMFSYAEDVTADAALAFSLFRVLWRRLQGAALKVLVFKQKLR